MKQAKAAYAFTARSEAEISFDVGDVIVILEQDSSGWGKGRTKEYKEGYFPLTYVQVEELSDSDSDNEGSNKGQQKLQCISLYDFSALSDLQLSFSKGDVLKITKKGSENDWWEGILERTQQRGLFPSNYVRLVDPTIIQTPNQRIEEPSTNNNNNNNILQENRSQNKESKFNEPRELKQHKRNESDFHVEDSIETEPPISTLVPPNNPSKRPSTQNTSVQFPNNLSPLDVSTPFEIHTGNYHREFAALSPISPSIAALTYDSAEMARRRHSMNISSASPLSLSSFSGEYTRDFDALCLLYPFVPSSVSQNAPPSQPPFPLAKATIQPIFVSPSSTPQHTTSQPIPIPIPTSLSSHQIPQSRPQSAPQFLITPRQSTSAKQPTSPQHATTPSSQPSSTPPKPVVPKLPLTSPSPDRKDRYSNRDSRERSHASAGAANASTQAIAPSSASSGAVSSAKAPARTSSRYGSIKSPGARRDANASAGNSSKRKVKLEASLSMGKKPNATITHSNSTPEQPQDPTQANSEAKPKEEAQQTSMQPQNEVEYLKKILQQEVELRAHLESVVHDAHGKMHSASQYIKDLKAELFQAHMDISQLRVTNRQLNEQLDKYQLVTRVTVATQTERDENIDKIRVLTEQIHELEETTDLLNEQIVMLKNRPLDRSPRNVDRSPRGGDKGANEAERALVSRGDVSVDYAAVKQQFARVRECLLLEKDIKDRLIIEKAQTEERLLKAEQNSKQIRRKLLTELQLKSDLNVRNQQIELQMQRMKEELTNYRHLTSSPTGTL